jgi:glycosyltransferase involved in cell wall biosynthesis
MRSEPILTIGIPTYKRPYKLLELLEHLSPELNSKKIDVLLIDDGDDPATATNAARFAGHSGFIHLKNETNMGYTWTFCRLLEECQTEYLLVTADDDLIETGNIEKFERILRKNRPDFACPIYTLKGEIYRGVLANRSIAPTEYIACSGHAPGIIYRVEAFRPLVPLIYKRLEERKSDAVCYPQVLCAIATLLQARAAIFIGLVSAFDNGNLPSELNDTNGKQYSHYESRLQQFAAFDEFIANFPTDYESIREEMLRAHRAGFIQRVIYAWKQIDPSSEAAFERQMIWNYLSRRAPRKSKDMLKLALGRTSRVTTSA